MRGGWISRSIKSRRFFMDFFSFSFFSFFAIFFPFPLFSLQYGGWGVYTLPRIAKSKILGS